MGSLTCGVKKFHLTNIVAHIIYPHTRTFSVKTDGDNSFDDHGDDHDRDNHDNAFNHATNTHRGMQTQSFDYTWYKFEQQDKKNGR